MQFNKHSQTYHSQSFLQRFTAQSLMNKLYLMQSPKNILEIGCGSGNLTKIINHKYPESNLYALDISPKMLQIIQNNKKLMKNNIYFAADACKIVTKKKVDLLLSNMTMQWIDTLEDSLIKLSKICKNMAISILIEGSLKNWNNLYKLYGHKSPVLNFPTTNNLYKIFAKLGLKNQIITEQVTHFFIKPIYFAKQIKLLGAYNKLNDCYGLLKIIKNYTQSIEIEYNIAYCLLWNTF
ncbi:hypothetical protein CAXC1_340004 [Candidatus Xenohaliotis californiensis]|uniref:Methyltransferase type 11 domain-containing protein n=1 Tax=Candidatus Xenohaliotis californiensis TaxID=84677 RepID=A0ABP0ETK6_9RICK|nr:hypothetical protein CAXC1_340004 [Candidatus Xenohaliotis californiensis]